RRDVMQIGRNVYIDEAELSERFVHASGPGGQNVNKVATAVQLRFDARHSASLPDTVRSRLLAMRDPRITGDGVIVITANRFRSQARDRADARQRLAGLVARAARPPKTRHSTRPPARANEKRLQHKKQQGRIKRLRKPPTGD